MYTFLYFNILVNIMTQHTQSDNREVPTPVKLDVSLKKRLKAIGDKQDRSIHYLMKKAVEEFVEKEEQADALKQETLSSWEQAVNGETVSNDEVMAWLDTWGTENETEAP